MPLYMIVNSVSLHVFVFQFYLGSGSHKEKTGYRPADTVTSTSSLIISGSSILPKCTRYHFSKLLTRPHAHSHEDTTMCGGGQLISSPILLHLAISKGDQVPQQLISSPVLLHLTISKGDQLPNRSSAVPRVTSSPAKWT